MSGLLNPLTGESELGGIHFVLTADAWLRIEKALGVTTMKLLERAAAMDLGFEECQIVVYCGAEAWRRRNAPQAPTIGPDRVLDAVGEAGLIPTVGVIADAIQGSTALGMGASKKSDGEGEDPFPAGPR